MNETTTISVKPWELEGYLGEVYIEGDEVETRTFQAAHDAFGKLRLYDASGQARSIKPYDRQKLAVIVEDAEPAAQAILVDALKADRWKNVTIRA